MNYYINPACLTSAFTVPSVVVDNHLKFAKAEHLKVLLYIMRNIMSDAEISVIAEACDLSEYEVNEALLYWADAGVLCPKDIVAVAPKPQKAKSARVKKPTINDVTRRGNEDPKIAYMLREAELKFGRFLTPNEKQSLLWLYDDNGIDVSLILYIVQIAVERDKANVRFIETMALDWMKKGIETLADADNEVRRMAMGEKAWRVVCSAFGLEARKPSQKETELSLKWIDEWGFSQKMLVAAYEACVDTKSKFSIAYVAKILENWHKKGYTKPEDIEKKPKENKEQNDIAAYDLDLFEKMINSKD